MRQKGLKIKIRHGKLRNKGRRCLLCFGSGALFAAHSAVHGGEGGESRVWALQSYLMVNNEVRISICILRTSFHPNGYETTASLQEVSWSPGSSVPQNVCICSFVLLAFLVPFLCNTSDPNDMGFEICASIRHLCFFLQPENKLHLQNVFRWVSLLKEWSHHCLKWNSLI